MYIFSFNHTYPRGALSLKINKFNIRDCVICHDGESSYYKIITCTFQERSYKETTVGGRAALPGYIFFVIFFIFYLSLGEGGLVPPPNLFYCSLSKTMLPFRDLKLLIHYLSVSGYFVFGDVPRRRAQTTTTTTTMTRITITAMTIPAIAPPSKPSSDDTTDVMKKKDSCTF